MAPTHLSLQLNVLFGGDLGALVPPLQLLQLVLHAVH